jgi:hypothetical protein
MLKMPGSPLLGISSPYAKSGLLFEKYWSHYRRDGSKVLVWQAETMNPQVDPAAHVAAYPVTRAELICSK